MTVTPRTSAFSINTQIRADQRWYEGRIQRGLDNRDLLLAEAIQRLEASRPDQGFPVVLGISPELASPAIGGGTVSGTITGLSLLGLRLAKATETFGTGNAALTVEAVLPGTRGNSITITIEDTGASLAVTVDGAAISVVHDADTATAIAAAINAHADAKYLVNVTAGGTGGSSPADVAETALSGGKGPTALLMGDVPMAAALLTGGDLFKVTSWTNTEITVDIDVSAAVGGTEYQIFLFCDGIKQFVGSCVPRAQKMSGLDILSGTLDGGAWAKAATSGGLATVTHTPAAGAQSYWIPLPKVKTGDLIVGVDANYSAGVAVADDIRFEIWAETLGADNAAPTAAVLMGDDNADYDAAHNTAAERGDITAAPELHKIAMRNAGTPVVAEDDKVYKLRVLVDGDSGASNTFVLKNAVLVTA